MFLRFSPSSSRRSPIRYLACTGYIFVQRNVKLVRSAVALMNQGLIGDLLARLGDEIPRRPASVSYLFRRRSLLTTWRSAERSRVALEAQVEGHVVDTGA